MSDTVYSKNILTFGTEDARYEFQPGDKVDRSLFSDEQWKGLVEGGAFTTTPPSNEEATDETEELLAIGAEAPSEIEEALIEEEAQE